MSNSPVPPPRPGGSHHRDTALWRLYDGLAERGVDNAFRPWARTGEA